MNRKIVNIQALRGIAALAVLLPHLRRYDMRFGGNYLPGQAIWDLGNAGVDLFFVISGFVMVATTMGRSTPTVEPGRFLIRRAARIYPLYWFFSLIVLAVYFKNSAMVNAHAQGLRINIWKSFLLYPQKATPLVAQGWTLIHEIYFYLIFAILLKVRQTWLPVFLLGWGALVTAGTLSLVNKSPAVNVIANPLTLEFIAGCFLALAVQRGYARHGGWALVAGVVLLFIGGMRLTDLSSPWQRVAYYGIPAAMIVFGAVAIEQAGKTSPRWLIVTGDASYSIYLSQGLILAALARWAWEKKHIPTGHLINPLVATAMSAVAIVAAFACYWIVEIPLIGVTKRWFDSGGLRSAEKSRHPGCGPPGGMGQLLFQSMRQIHRAVDYARYFHAVGRRSVDYEIVAAFLDRPKAQSDHNSPFAYYHSVCKQRDDGLLRLRR